MQSKSKVQEKQKGALPPAEGNDDGWTAVLSPVLAVGGFFSSLVSPVPPQKELAPEEQEEDERYARFLKRCVTKEKPESKEHRHRDRKNGKHREKKTPNHDRDDSKRRSRDDGERRKKRDDRQTDSSGQPKQSSNEAKKNAPNSPPSQVSDAGQIVRQRTEGAVGNHPKEPAENKSKQVQESARNADSSIGKTNTGVSGRLDSRDDPLSIIRNNYSIDDGNANQGGPGYSSSNYSGPSLQNPRYSSSNYSVPPPQHPGYSSINYGVPPHQYPNQGGPGYSSSNYFIPPPPPQHPGYSSINYGVPPHQYPNQGGPGYPWSNYFVPPPPPQQGTLPPPLPQQGGQSGSTVSPTPTPPSREDHTNHKRGGEGEGEREHRHRDRKSDDRDDTKKHRETITGVVGRLNGSASQDDDGGISRNSGRKHSHRDRRHDDREDRNKRGGRHYARKQSHSRKDKHHDNDDWYSDRKHSHRDKRDDDRERNRRGGRYHAREQSHRRKDKHYDNDDRSSSSNSSCSSGTSNSDDASLNDSVSTTSSAGSSTTSGGSISVSSETSSEADSEYMTSLIAEGASTTLSVATRAVQSIGNLKTRMEVDALKKKADKYFLVGKLQEAKDIYNRAEKLDPFHIQVLMNRAACHLAMRDSAACLKDCNNALNLLSQGKPKSDSSACALPDGCTKRKWQVFLLCRRAAAKELAHDFRGALCDLEDAKKIARNDDVEDIKEIARDIDNLKAKMNSINTKVKTKGNQSLSAMLGLSFM